MVGYIIIEMHELVVFVVILVCLMPLLLASVGRDKTQHNTRERVNGGKMKEKRAKSCEVIRVTGVALC